MSPMTRLLNRYRYDALDRLVELEPLELGKLTRFYRGEHLVTQLKGQDAYSVLQHDRQLLAVQSLDGGERNSLLLVTDLQRSVLQMTGPDGDVRQVYAPYGHRRVESGPGGLLGFTGEVVDPATGHYLLGNGHRAFNPVLMRFNIPDSLSPFGRGGLNAYAYCLGDPVNFSDPTGQFAVIARILTSIGTLFNSIITLRPSIPFQVGVDALANGAFFRLPLRHTAGAASAVVAGVSGVAGAAVGLGSTITAAINPTSTLLAPLANTSLGLMSTSVIGRMGSWWAARDVAVLPALRNLAGGMPSALPQRATPRVDTIIDLDPFPPTAPPAPPGTPQPSAPPATPGTFVNSSFNFDRPNRSSEMSMSANGIRRRYSR